MGGCLPITMTSSERVRKEVCGYVGFRDYFSLTCYRKYSNCNNFADIEDVCLPG